MPAGDETFVGSKGAKLRGELKQRIVSPKFHCYSATVYARKRIACFDDALSGLDNATAQLVFDNVFGPARLLRRLDCCAGWAAPLHRLQQADFIIVLGDNSQVLEQGSYPQLRSHIGGYIHMLDMQSEQMNRLAGTVDNSVRQAESLNTTTGSLSSPSTTGGSRQANDLSVYMHHFSNLSGMRVSILLLFLIVNAGIGVFRYTWVNIWSSSSDSASHSRFGS
ncbi:hypothetical protein BBP40_008726 [Aspergillus hancockii]|nr:hypothetical protein BBP40_008726 [Aspergillus hancockii]